MKTSHVKVKYHDYTLGLQLEIVNKIVSKSIMR